MTAVARLAAGFAVATLALGWAAGANAVDVLPAGSNANSGAPAAQSYTVLNPFSRTASITTDYNYGKTSAGDPTADQNAFADLGPLFIFDPVLPTIANAGDALVMVKRTLEATPDNSSTPVEQIPGGFGVVDSFTLLAAGPLALHAQVAGPEAIAPGGAAFGDFTLSLFRLDGGGDGMWDVAGGAVDGDTTLIGSGAGASVAALNANLFDALALYAVVVQAVVADPGLFNKVDYELALTFGELVGEAPLPAAFWLLASGLVGLFGFAKVRRAASAT